MHATRPWAIVRGTNILRRTIFAFVCCVLVVAISGAVSPAHAATLYAASAAGSAGTLYTLDPSNGAVLQTIGSLDDASGTNYPITGLAFHPTTGVLYGSTGNSPSATAARLVTIDPATALVTVIGSFNAGPVNSSGTPATMADLGFDPAGNLYGVGSIGGPQLYSINPVTAQATVVGSTGLTSTTGGGLAISPAGTFYGTPTASRFGTYNSGTGAYTDIANPAKPAGGGAYGALDFSGSVLYGLNVGPGSPPPSYLVTIDPATGAVTALGPSINSLDAIAFQIPEPASLGMLALGLVALMHGRRR
jgi:hypothetical protein